MKKESISHIIVLMLVGMMVLSLCGCEVKSELPVYQQVPMVGTGDLSKEGMLTQEVSEEPAQEVVYIQDEVLLAEIEDTQLHGITPYSEQFGKYLGIRELAKDEIQPMHEIADGLIANFYNWNHTSHNEEHLQTGYNMLNHDLQEKLSEVKCFEKLIHDVYTYTFDTKIRYANILDHNVVSDYQSEEYGRVSCIRAEIILHTVADQRGVFYDLYDYYVKGDTLLELFVFVRNVGGQLEVVAWEEFFCNPDHLTVYYPQYIGQVSVQPEQINAISLATLYESTNDARVFEQKELDSIKGVLTDFIESNVLIQSTWQPNYEIFTKQQCLELESRAPEVAYAIEIGNPQIEIRDLKCDALDKNEFAVYRRKDDDTEAYRLTLTYMLKNKGESVYQLMLYKGIYTYSTDIMLICEDNIYKIDFWKTNYTSDGALDIDFNVLTTDQG